MPRRNTVKVLPPDIRDQIGALLDQGRTLDEIRAHLAALGADVSRSALGRYRQHIAKVSERIRRSREIAEAIVRNQLDEPESKTTRLNIELLHGVINDMLSQIPGPDEAAENQGEQEALVSLNPMGAMLMAKALDHLAKAKRSDADLVEKLREQERRKAREEMAERVKALGSAEDLKKLSDEELAQRIAALAGK